MKKVKVGKSKIHGNGLFADEPIKRGDVIELVHTIRELEPGVIKTTPTLLGRNYNHSDDSNALNVVDGNNRYLVALKEIEAGGEITTDYRTNPELEQPGSFTTNDNYISFDYDDTLTTPEGFKLAQQMNKEGKNLYVITARDKVTPQMIERAEAAGIPKENIIPAGSDEAKVRIIKENNINKHIDNKDSVIKALGDKGELFVPDAYPDLKADFIEMDLTTNDLNKLKEGGFIVEESPDKGIITQEEIDAANNAMMKARLAYAYMHGNPAAQRMVVAPDQPYDFGDGMTGTHYMASMDNYAVPQIQNINGQLMLGDYGPDSAEAIRFDNPEDANYFAENYKQVTPDASYRQEEYSKGGDPGKGKKGKKSKSVQPFVTSDPAEYAKRKAAYDDSLNLYNLNKNFRDATNKYFLTNYDHLTKPTTKNTKAEIEQWKKVIAASEKWDAYKRKSKVPNKPSGSFKNIGSGLSGGYGNINVNAPGVKVLKKKGNTVLIESTSLGYQKPLQSVVFQKKQEPIVNQEVIEPTPVPQPIPTPIPVTVNPELQKFVEERKPEPEPGTGADVMPVYDTDELPMYATPDGGAEWVGDTERYVDWDGNRIPYRLPRFRKPGHGGDLIRRGKQRYIPFPSIESRYQAEIVPEEEYKKGGEPKTRKKDSKGRSRSEDGNIRTPLTPEMQAIMSPEEWGQYVQDVPEVYTTRTKEQQDIRNALDYQQRMAELYPGRPTQSDAIQPADWFWQLGMLGAAGGLGKSTVNAAEAAGSRALPYITGALETSIPGMASVPGATVGNALGAIAAVDSGRRLLDVPGQVQKGDYADAAANVLTGALDISTAGIISPLYKGAKATATELKAALDAKNPANFQIPEQWYKKALYDLYDKGTDSYKLVEIDVPQEVIPGRSYDDVKHKLKNLRSDLNISPTEHYLSRIFGRSPIGMSRDRIIADPTDARLFDSNTRYWLNRSYGNTPSGPEVISEHLLAKDYGKLYKEGLSFKEARDIMKKYNDPIEYKEVPKELPGSPNTFKSSLGSIDMSKYEIKNPDYFTQLLKTYDSRKLSPTNKNFYKGIIESVKKQNGIATERQYNELQRLRTGDFNFGKKGYSNGGSISQFENKRFDHKLSKFIR